MDYAACVPEEMLQSFDVVKGLRRVISVDERSKVMEALQENGCSSQVIVRLALHQTFLGIRGLGYGHVSSAFWSA